MDSVRGGGYRREKDAQHSKAGGDGKREKTGYSKTEAGEEG